MTQHRKRKLRSKGIEDRIYSDLLEIDSQFAPIIFTVIPAEGQAKSFESIMDTVSYLRKSGGALQIHKEKSKVLLYEAFVDKF